MSTIEQAALAAVDSGRLLEGEDPETSYPDDAASWLRVYTELVAFKRGVVARTEAAMRELSSPAVREIVGTDLPILAAELTRLEARLAFWRARHEELFGLTVDRESGTVQYGGRSASCTRRDMQLLEALIDYQQEWLTPARLLSLAWHDPALSQEQLRIYIARVRRLLVEIEAPYRVAVGPGRRGYRLMKAVADSLTVSTAHPVQ